MIINPNEPHVLSRLKVLEHWADKTIDGVQYNVDGPILHYGECDTPSDTVIKIISVPNFKIRKGSRITIKFVNGSVSDKLALNVNNTGAKYVYAKNNYFTDHIEPYTLCTFIYTGSFYELVSDSYIYKGATEDTDGIPGLYPKALAGQGRYLLHGDGKFYDDLTAIDNRFAKVDESIENFKKRFTEYEESTNKRLVALEAILQNGLVKSVPILFSVHSGTSKIVYDTFALEGNTYIDGSLVWFVPHYRCSKGYSFYAFQVANSGITGDEESHYNQVIGRVHGPAPGPGNVLTLLNTLTNNGMTRLQPCGGGYDMPYFPLKYDSLWDVTHSDYFFYGTAYYI